MMDSTFSFSILFEQYVAAQNLLRVLMEQINYQHIRHLMPGGQGNFYNKRAGRYELSSQEMIVLADFLNMPALSSVASDLRACTQQLQYSLAKTSPALIRALELEPELTHTLIRLRTKQASRWKNADIALALEVLISLHAQLTDLLNLPGVYKKNQVGEESVNSSQDNP